MIATIQKWGNSNAIRIPKSILDDISIKENDKVTISVKNESIIIKKTNSHKSIKDRFKSFYGSNLNNYPMIIDDEEFNNIVGDEQW